LFEIVIKSEYPVDKFNETELENFYHRDEKIA